MSLRKRVAHLQRAAERRRFWFEAVPTRKQADRLATHYANRPESERPSCIVVTGVPRTPDDPLPAHGG